MKVHNVNRSRAIVFSFLKHSDVLSWSAQEIWGKQLVKLKYRWPFESVWGVPTRLQNLRQFRTYLSEAMHVCLWISPYVIAYHTRVMKATKNTRSPHYFGYKIRNKNLDFCFKWEWCDERSPVSFGLMRAFRAWMVDRGFSTTTIRVTTNTWRSHIREQCTSYVAIMNNRTASFLFID